MKKFKIFCYFYISAVKEQNEYCAPVVKCKLMKNYSK